jgi:hypothetical protein
LLLVIAPFAAGQTAANQETPAPQLAPRAAAEPVVEQAHLDLPDSPGALVTPASSSSTSADASGEIYGESSMDDQAAPTATPKRAPHLQMTIYPGETADPMTVKEKIVGGLKDSVSLFSAAGWLGAAGWEQLWNGSPNYGTDSGAFGVRLGAAAVRGISEGVFSESLFAPLFHEDPRYYVLGKGHNFFKRAFYAGTRVLITRNDAGHNTANLSLIAGNAAGSALTIPYYPSQNTSFKEVAATFGGSLGGSAVGFVVDEFIVDFLVELHLKKQP